jgi:hypothetical protein
MTINLVVGDDRVRSPAPRYNVKGKQRPGRARPAWRGGLRRRGLAVAGNLAGEATQLDRFARSVGTGIKHIGLINDEGETWALLGCLEQP